MASRWQPFIDSALRPQDAQLADASGASDRSPERAEDRNVVPSTPLGSMRRLDLRLFPSALGAWAAAFAGTRCDSLIAAGAAGTLVLLSVTVLLGSRHRRLRRRSAALALPLLIGALVLAAAGGFTFAASSGPLAAAVSKGSTITAELEITGEPRTLQRPDAFTGAERVAVEGTVRSATADGLRFSAAMPVLVLGDAAWMEVTPGDRVRSAGQLGAAEPGDRVAALLTAKTVPNDIRNFSAAASEPDPGGNHGAGDLAARLRTGLRESSAWLWPEAAGLLPGIVIGDRSALNAELEAAMKATGLTHLTAVSGANCSLILGGVILLCRSLRMPRWPAAGTAGCVLLAFVSVVGADPSVLRAAVMGLIGVAAVLSGRPGRTGMYLCVAVIALLAMDPWLSDSFAFILSVLATSGLVLFGKRCAEWLGNWMPPAFAQAVAVPVSAQLFCAPVVVLLQPQLTSYSLPANLLVAPVMAVATIVGTLILPALILAPAVVPALVAVAGLACQWIALVALFCSSLPGATLPWPDGPGGVALMAALSLAVIALLWTAAHRRVLSDLARRLGAAAPAWVQRRRRLVSLGKYIALFLTAGLVAAGLAAVPAAAGLLHQVRDWKLVACDVGQGDGLVVRTNARSAIVIDAGPEPALMRRCLDDLSVTVVDLLVLTHFHADHYGGTAGVLDGRKVTAALVSAAAGPLPASIEQQLRKGAVPVERVAAGVDRSTGPVRWQVLWPLPPSSPVPAAPDDQNNASVVLSMQIDAGEGGPLTVLLSGDLESDAAARMMADPVRRPGHVDVLKVAHHGARNGGTQVLETVRPRLAVVSVGAGNDYGHPAPSTLDALEAIHAQVARTDKKGRVYVDKKGAVLEWSGER